MENMVRWLAYNFSVYELGASWHEVAGLYIFAGINTQGRWQAAYVGQAVSFAQRIPNHEQWPEARRLGATHVHAMVESRAAMRDAMEQELIRACDPPLNVQHHR